MKLLWTVVKVVLALVLIVPLTIIVLATTLGLLGALFGLAVFLLKIGVAVLLIAGLFKLIGFFLGGGSKPVETPVVRELPPRDRHYDAAMRELDQELGPSR